MGSFSEIEEYYPTVRSKDRTIESAGRHLEVGRNTGQLLSVLYLDGNAALGVVRMLREYGRRSNSSLYVTYGVIVVERDFPFLDIRNSSKKEVFYQMANASIEKADIFPIYFSVGDRSKIGYRYAGVAPSLGGNKVDIELANLMDILGPSIAKIVNRSQKQLESVPIMPAYLI